MKRTKKTISLLLAMLTLLSIVTPVLAAEGDPTVETSGSTHVSISQGTRNTILQDQNNVALGGMAWSYTANRENVTGPAYCIAHGLTAVPEGTQLALGGRYEANAKVTGAFASGYPQVTLAEFRTANSLPALTEDEYAYATQLAVWAALGQLGVEGTAFTQGAQQVQRPTSGDAQQLRTFTALQAILAGANQWTKNLYRGMGMRWQENIEGHAIELIHAEGMVGIAREDTNGVKLETINGKQYYTFVFYAASATSTKPNDNVIDIVPYGPTGTILVATNNTALSTRTLHSGSTSYMVPTTRRDTGLNVNGEEYYGAFKLCIPADNVAPQGEVKLIATGIMAQYELYAANNPNSTQQSYILADPATGRNYAEGLFRWSSDEETEEKRLEVTKTSGTGAPLSGAVFRLEGSDESSETKTTGADGLAVFEGLDANVQYTLHEDTPPEGYAPIQPRPVALDKNAATTYLTIRNDGEPKLRVKKIDQQNGRVLMGGVFVFEQIDGGFKTTGTTWHDGYIEFGSGQLPFGSYRVYEQSSPAGYLKSERIETVHWTGEADVELAFENVRIPQIMLVKSGPYDEPVQGAIFDVYKDGQKIDTITTNEAGIAHILCGLGEGYYEVVETNVGLPYILDDVTRHGIHFDPHNPAVENDPVLRVVNKRIPSLIIEKMDAQALTTFLPGARFEVKIADGQELPGSPYTTGPDGRIIISATELQGYTFPLKLSVKELSAPSGFLIDNPEARIITLEPGKDHIERFTDTRIPTLTIEKVDAQSTTTFLPGAQYEVKIADGQALPGSPYTTGPNGKITIGPDDLQGYAFPLKLSITEIAPPSGFLIDDPVPRIITLEPGKNHTERFTDTRIPTLTIEKVDAQSTTTFLPGAQYEVKLADGQELPGSPYTTGPDGKITIGPDDLKGYTFPLKLSIREIAPPSGYVIDQPEARFVTLEPGKDHTERFTDTRKPSLTIHKSDSIVKDPVAHAKFQIWRAVSDSLSGELIDLGIYYSDENGEIHLPDAEVGWHRVTELEPPAGYALKEPSTQDVFLTAGKDHHLYFENIPLSAIIIHKEDEQTSAPIPDTWFRVRYLGGTSGTGGTIVYQGKTSANGTIVITGLKQGTYVIEEFRSNEQWELSGETQTVYLSGKDQDVITVIFTNKKKGEVWIEKLSGGKDRKPLPGAKFLVTESNGAVIGPNNGYFTTDENGLINLDEYLSPGMTIVAREVEAPFGYTLDPVSQVLEIKQGTVHKLTFVNQPIGGVRLLKLGETTPGVRNPLPDTEFEISHMGGEVVGTYRTDQSGVIELALEAGWYQAVEKSVSPPYVLDGTPHVFEVKSNGEFIPVEVVNYQKASLIIFKGNAAKKSQGLGGARFLVTDSNGAPIGPGNGYYVSDKNGYVTITQELAPGTVITVREVEAPQGYQLDPDSQSITIRANTRHELYFYNQPIGGAQIVKRDEKDNTAIPGTVISVSHMNGARVGTFTTDRHGMIYLPQLEDGWYTAIEEKSSAGYILDTSPVHFEVKGGTCELVIMTNRKASGILLKKIDSVTKAGIYGVTFLLYDSHKNPMGQYETDQDGVVFIGLDDGLPAGKYYLRELRNDGYVVDDQLKTIWLEYGKTTEIVWENQPVRGQIQVIKYAADHNTITGKPAGSLLEGAVFEISQARSGAVVGYIATDARGVAASDPLPLGRYIIREVTAPAFYQLSSEPFDVTLEYAGQIIRLSAYNQSAVLGTTISKAGNNQVIAGDSMRYDFSGIANTSNVPLSDFYWSDRIPTDAVRAQTLSTGTYSQRVYYRLLYKTNYAEWKVLASNLISTNNYSFNLTSSALGLMSGEVVTDIKLEFGMVEPGFTSVTKPMLTVLTLATLPANYQIVNRCEVGGRYQGAWQIANDVWITKVIRYTPGPGKPQLPTTGY